MGLLDRFRRNRPDTADGFRYAVVGLGRIAEHFLAALADSPTCTVAAVISGDAKKAERFAKKYHVGASGTYSDFESVCRGAGVDAVYLALPVGLHREWTERAAGAGVHVLCEKPMAPTVEDARAMIAACQDAGVLLSIAYRCPHHALHQRLRWLVSMGLLGEASTLRIESGFGAPLGQDWRESPGLAGGGSMYDLGVYCLNAARFLLREEPCGVEDAAAVCDEAGMERDIRWTSVFPSGARATCHSSYQEKVPNTLRVTGSAGSLLLAPAFSHRDRYRLQGSCLDPDTGRELTIDERTPSPVASEFRLEAEQLAAAARTGVPLLTPGEDGLADMAAMEAIYAAAGVPAVVSQRA